MKLRLIIALGLGLAAASSQVSAFQEQQGTAVPSEAAAQAAPAAGEEKQPAADLSGPDAAKSASEGTEVSIPGLGKLGVLPKMDFGLELLYGADGKPEAPEEPAAQDGDLTIRGSVKHKF